MQMRIKTLYKKLLKWQNELKLLLLNKNPTKSTYKNFLLIIYLLYYRYSVEIGISGCSITEVIILNTIFLFLFISIYRITYNFIFTSVKNKIKMTIKIYKIYKNLESDLE